MVDSQCPKNKLIGRMLSFNAPYRVIKNGVFKIINEVYKFCSN